MAYLDYGLIQTTVYASQKSIVALSPLSAAIILACGAFYRRDYFWLVDGETPTDTEIDEIMKATALMELEIQSAMIGMIIPNVLGNYTGLELLPCDGSTYLKADYPELYEAIDPVFIIDAVSFSVPDLRDKFPLSVGVENAMGDSGGEKDHTLTIAELPAHDHNYTTPTFNVDIESVGVPDPTGVGNPPAIATTTQTGGNSPHNNMPPFLAIKFGIVAR